MCKERQHMRECGINPKMEKKKTEGMGIKHSIKIVRYLPLDKTHFCGCKLKESIINSLTSRSKCSAIFNFIHIST